MSWQKSVDGIKKIKNPAKRAKFFPATSRPKFASPKILWWGVLLAAFFAVISGSVLAVYANLPSADSQARVLGAFDSAILPENPPAVSDEQSSDAAAMDIFANTVLSHLKEYVISQAAESQLPARQAKLKNYLEAKGSPFAADDRALEAFVRSPHMELMLAISFAESTLGRKCYFNNCSGIGGYVPTLRKYKETANWVLDFNRLLERKYKDWTLLEMCGVYVKPCNQNWLLATRTALDELRANGLD